MATNGNGPKRRKIMNKFITKMTIAASLLLTPILANAADESFSPAAICVVQPNGTLTFGSQGQISNTSASTQSAFCGVGQEQIFDGNDDAVVFYQDSTATGSLFCGAVENNSDWSSIVFGDQKWSCAVAGGCAAQNNAFTGTGTLRIADISHGGNFVTTLTCNLSPSTTVRALTLDEQ
jgi:hypothetical protein